MRFLLLNQAFVPDTVATAQYAADLASALVSAGHDVTVIASSRSYDNPKERFAKRETWKGVKIIRVRCTGFGKKSRWRRALDFATFLSSCFLALAFQTRFDVVVAMTSPPLISVIATLFVWLRPATLVSWLMDVNPDEAIAAGWLAKDSVVARFLEWLLRVTLNHSDRIVVLDEFMRKRIIQKGVRHEKIIVISPWSHDSYVKYDAVGRVQFRSEFGVQDKFVVMYSGNHSPCHPLHTLLHAARKLREYPDIAFCFIGGGSEFVNVKAFARMYGMSNVVCLPYRKMAELSAALSAADLHTVVMGDPFVGILHPCKIYNILSLGIPFLYIGPERSHITALACEAGKDQWAFFSRHGEVDRVIQQILAVKGAMGLRPEMATVATNYSFDVLISRFIDALTISEDDWEVRVLQVPGSEGQSIGDSSK